MVLKKKKNINVSKFVSKKSGKYTKYTIDLMYKCEKLSDEIVSKKIISDNQLLKRVKENFKDTDMPFFASQFILILTESRTKYVPININVPDELKQSPNLNKPPPDIAYG